jgi:hypothetical protein
MNELYRYLTLAVSNDWRLLDGRQREEDKAEFASAVRSTSVAVHAYSTCSSGSSRTSSTRSARGKRAARRHVFGRRARVPTRTSQRGVPLRTSETIDTPAARPSGPPDRWVTFRTSWSIR